MLNIAPTPEPGKMLPPRPRTKAEKIARMAERAEALAPEDVELLDDDDVEEISDTDFIDTDNDEAPSGIHSIPPPPSLRKAETKIEDALDTATLQLERTVEARTVRLVDGIKATYTMEKPGKRADSERSGDSVLVHEDPEIGPMAGVFDGLGGEGNDAVASEQIVRVLPGRLTEAHNALRDVSAEELREIADTLSIVMRETETGALVHAKTPNQKRIGLLLDLYPEITKKAAALSRALQAANEDVIASGGKTTASFSVIHEAEDGGIFAITANIGDSGTLVRRANGDVEIVTMEDNLLDQLIEGGFLSAELLEQMKKEPTKQFAIPRLPKSFSYADIKRANTQALGGKSVEPRISVTELQKGDSLIGLTDGYLDFLEHEGELDIDAVKGALKESDPIARMNRLREITSLLARVQKQEGEALKEPDDMAAVELSV